MSDNLMSGNKSAEQIIHWGKSYWIENCFNRASLLKPCPTGATGACCKMCHMGPCRFVKSSEERTERGVCGATLHAVVARNFLRMAASGATVHSYIARNLAFTLRGIANGDIKDFSITDVNKLQKVAQMLETDYEEKNMIEVARKVADRLIDDLGRQTGALGFLKRVPEKTRQRWEKWNIVPSGIDRDIIEAIYDTNIGVNLEPESLLLSSLRVALSDGWGSAMIATELSDIIFGTPLPVMSDAGFGIFKEDKVNILIIAHDPSLAKKIMDVASESETVEYAETKGAKGINLGEISLIRYGIPSAGGFTNQELCLMTGIIDAVYVDSNCIMPTLVDVANNFHTKVVSTSHKANIPGAVQIKYYPERAGEVAREIVMQAIDNYPNRTGMGERVTDKYPMLTGFSLEYFENINGAGFRASISDINNAVKKGHIRGIAGLVGSDNPRVLASGIHKYLAEELIADDVLILATGSGSSACATSGYLDPEYAVKKAGAGLQKMYETTGLPPILSMGSSFDNSRILSLLSAMVKEGGLSYEISGIPMVIIAPEWLAETEVTAACYFAASGVTVIMGGTSPVKESEDITQIMAETWLERFGGALYFEADGDKMLDTALKCIDKARYELNTDPIMSEK